MHVVGEVELMSEPIGAERRRWKRKSPDECPWLVDARLRSGTEVRVIDISPGGVLLESASQILPNARVELFLISDAQRLLVKGRIIRCRVHAIMPEEGVRYRAALVFQEPVALLDSPEVESVNEPIDMAAVLPKVRAFAVPAPMLLRAAS